MEQPDSSSDRPKRLSVVGCGEKVLVSWGARQGRIAACRTVALDRDRRPPGRAQVSFEEPSQKKSTSCRPRTHELSLCLCLQAGVISGFLVAFAPFRNHGENVVTFGKLMPDEPASNDRAGSADAANSERKRQTSGELSVNVVKDLDASTVGMPKSGISND